MRFGKKLDIGERFCNLGNIWKIGKNWSFEKKLEIWKNFGNSEKIWKFEKTVIENWIIDLATANVYHDLLLKYANY